MSGGGGGGELPLFRQYGVDPLSRAVGLEPASLGAKVATMGGGGGGGNTATTVTNVNYSPEEAARREKVMGAAETLFGNAPATPPPYPGAQPVGFSPETQQAQQMVAGAVPQLQQNAAMTNNALQFGMRDIIYGEDPTLQNAITAATRPIHEAFTSPGGYFAKNRSDMIGSEMLGSSRDALANAVIGENYVRGLGDTSAKLAAASRSDTLNTFGKSLALSPLGESAALAPANALATVGAQKEGLEQAKEDTAAAGRQWDLNYPWMNLQNYANIVFGGSAPGTTTTADVPRPTGNPVMGALGGAAAGYSMGGMIGGAANGATYGPYGAAVGALLGYMMSR